MRRVPRPVFTALVAASLHLSALHAATVQAIDDRGERIALAHPAQRVVTLAPHLTELVYAAGAAAALVGRTVPATTLPPPESRALATQRA